MADRGLERLFDTLSATFDAAIAREEEIAAADLAMSLRQGESLREELLRRAGTALILDGWGSARISEVGLDYLGAGRPVNVLVPSATALVRDVGGHEIPSAAERSLVGELRRWARSGRGRRVEIRTWQGEVEGRLLVVGRDYVVLRSATGEAAVGLNAVVAVRSVRGGSGDAP